MARRKARNESDVSVSSKYVILKKLTAERHGSCYDQERNRSVDGMAQDVIFSMSIWSIQRLGTQVLDFTAKSWSDPTMENEKITKRHIGTVESQVNRAVKTVL